MPSLKHCQGIVMYGRPRCCKGETDFKTAVELAVMYPAFALRYADRGP